MLKIQNSVNEVSYYYPQNYFNKHTVMIACVFMAAAYIMYPRKAKAIVVPVTKHTTVTDNDDYEQKYSDYQVAVWLNKVSESIRLQAFWDVTRYSIGWGTESYEGEEITYAEANDRFVTEYNKRVAVINKAYPNLTRWQTLVIAGVKYNVGTFGKKLDQSLKNGDMDAAAKYIKLYVHDSKGNKLTSLVERRTRDAKLLLMTKEERDIEGAKLQKSVTNKIKSNI